MRNLKTYKKFESRVYQNSFAEEGSSEILEDIEMMKDMLSDIRFPDYIEIMINKDDWYKGYLENTFKLTENIHKAINRFRKYFKSLGYSIQMYRTNWVITDGNSNHERLWISDDEFLDDDHKGINNKEVLRIQIRLT